LQSCCIIQIILIAKLTIGGSCAVKAFGYAVATGGSKSTI